MKIDCHNRVHCFAAVATGHSKGGGDVIIYAGIHDNIPLVINIAGRFWMKEGLTQRFGADISERVEQGPVNQKSTTERGKTIEWQLTQEVGFRLA